MSTQDEKLGRLYDYTKFHIGLYATLVTGLLALMSIGAGSLSSAYRLPVILMAVLFLLAGACGGIVSVNTFRHSSYRGLMRAQAVAYGKPLRWTVERYAQWEHRFFWAGIVVGLLSVILIPIFTSRPDPAGCV